MRRLSRTQDTHRDGTATSRREGERERRAETGSKWAAGDEHGHPSEQGERGTWPVRPEPCGRPCGGPCGHSPAHARWPYKAVRDVWVTYPFTKRRPDHAHMGSIASRGSWQHIDGVGWHGDAFYQYSRRVGSTGAGHVTRGVRGRRGSRAAKSQGHVALGGRREARLRARFGRFPIARPGHDDPGPIG